MPDTQTPPPQTPTPGRGAASPDTSSPDTAAGAPGTSRMGVYDRPADADRAGTRSTAIRLGIGLTVAAIVVAALFLLF